MVQTKRNRTKSTERTNTLAKTKTDIKFSKPFDWKSRPSAAHRYTHRTLRTEHYCWYKKNQIDPDVGIIGQSMYVIRFFTPSFNLAPHFSCSTIIYSIRMCSEWFIIVLFIDDRIWLRLRLHGSGSRGNQAKGCSRLKTPKRWIWTRFQCLMKSGCKLDLKWKCSGKTGLFLLWALACCINFQLLIFLHPFRITYSQQTTANSMHAHIVEHNFIRYAKMKCLKSAAIQ